MRFTACIRWVSYLVITALLMSIYASAVNTTYSRRFKAVELEAAQAPVRTRQYAARIG